MENKPDANVNPGTPLPGLIPGIPLVLPEKKTTSNAKNASPLLARDSAITLRSEAVFQSRLEYHADELAGAYYKGVQYLDFKNVRYVNSIIMARLISLLKPLLIQGIEIRLVNANERIRNKIKSLGLDNIFNCS